MNKLFPRKIEVLYIEVEKEDWMYVSRQLNIKAELIPPSGFVLNVGSSEKMIFNIIKQRIPFVKKKLLKISKVNGKVKWNNEGDRLLFEGVLCLNYADYKEWLMTLVYKWSDSNLALNTDYSDGLKESLIMYGYKFVN